MDQFTLLYYLSSVGGLVMIVGGIWLIYKQKIYIDSQTKQVTQIELPFLGKLKTNSPVVVLFVLGFAGLFYPIYKSETNYWHLRGEVSSGIHPVAVYAVVQSEPLPQDGPFDLALPKLSSGNYTPLIIYVAGSDPYVLQDSVDTSQLTYGVNKLAVKKIVGNEQPSRFQSDIASPPAEFKH
jgi:hypothetical protein